MCYSTQMTSDEMVHLRVTLSGCTISWLKAFFEQGGLVLLLRTLIDLERKFQLTKKSEKDLQTQIEIVRCLQAMMKTKVQILSVLTLDFVLLKTSDKIKAVCYSFIHSHCPRFSNILRQLGWQTILNYEGAIYQLTKFLFITKNLHIKVMILDALAAGCLIPPNGHQYILLSLILDDLFSYVFLLTLSHHCQIEWSMMLSRSSV